MAHPNYKHGLYSKHCLVGVVLRARIAVAKKLARTLAQSEAGGGTEWTAAVDRL